MSETFLVIGIVVTFLGILVITTFSFANFVAARIFRKERKEMSKEEKRKEKLAKRIVGAVKRILKFINKKCMENLLAFYGVTSAVIVGGVAVTTVSAVQVSQKMANIEGSSLSEITSSSETTTSSSEYITSSLTSITSST